LAAAIKFAMYNFNLTFFVLGVLVAGIQILKISPERRKSEIVYEIIFKWFLLFSIGFAYFYNFIVHTVFAEQSARYIGWANSPFQLEVGFASLGYAAVGILAFRKNWGLRLAAVVAPGLFMFGAAGGHIYQMIVANNFASGNAGIVFYADIFLPVFGGLMLMLTKPKDPYAG